ncbi:hypothetical protein [Agrococcus sp. ARC_14]|uniref:hypothetical protein n=1 Tax=Agrococcus sp. ARC_14 TaxID=2919927 RepID=UPI001F067D19|nr:hypothetical protein [Agrococcus sp. ARC_14]MCH1882144.1 hypothetical protein [Agrococcus sp. ARC_14]
MSGPVARAAAGERARSPVWALVTRMAALEKLIYGSIGRAVLRRPAVPVGANGFGYHSQSITVLVIFIVLSAFEIVIVDLIVHQWLIPRLVLLIVGIWGVVWMTGLLCAHVMRPHTVGPDGVRVRDGLDLDVHVPWSDVYSVTIGTVTDEPKSPRLVDDATTLAVRVSDATNISIVLEGATRVVLPGSNPKGGEQQISTVRLWADDPKAFLAAVGEHI